MKYGRKANLSTKSCFDIRQLEKLLRMQKVARNTRSCQKVAEQLVESPNRELGPLGESKCYCWSLHHVYRLDAPVKKLQKFINFCLKVGHSANFSGGSRPSDKGGARSPNFFSAAFGPQFGLKITGSGSPKPLPCICHWIWRIQSPHEDNLSSNRRYKIITSKALGTMHAQHLFIAGTFGNDRFTTIVVLTSGTFVLTD